MCSNRFPLCAALLALGGMLALSPAGAKEQPADPAASPASPQIEHLRTEDTGARIDETRSGGRMQQITVTPKGGSAAYEVLPADAPLPGAAPVSAGGAGPRVWNVLKF